MLNIGEEYCYGINLSKKSEPLGAKRISFLKRAKIPITN